MLLAKSIVKICSNSVIFAAEQTKNSIIKNLCIMKKVFILVTMILISVCYSFSQTTKEDYKFCDKICYDFVLNKPNNNYTIKIVKNDLLDNELCIIYCITNNKTQAKTYRVVYKGGDNTPPMLITFPNPKSTISVIANFKSVLNGLSDKELKELILFSYDKLAF
jgi:hypothetical protein